MKVFLFLISFILMIGQATNGENNKWQVSIEENVTIKESQKNEYRKLNFKNASQEFFVHALLFQPGSYRAELVDNPSNNPANYRPVAKLIEEKGAVAGVNGGFFTKEFTPNGLFIFQGKVLSPIKKLKSPVLAGLLLIDEKGTVALEPASSYSTKSNYAYGLQSGPFLIEPNNQISGYLVSGGMIASQVTKHTVLALSTENQLLVISTSPISLINLAECLKEYPTSFGVKKIKSALSLDGGRSSGFSARLPSKSVSIEEGWPVRNSVIFF